MAASPALIEAVTDERSAAIAARDTDRLMAIYTSPFRPRAAALLLRRGGVEGPLHRLAVNYWVSAANRLRRSEGG